MDFLGTILSLLWSKEAIWLVIGLFVGWNVLPQPAWVKNLVSKVLPKKE